jgi:hypothetical protein
MGHGGTKVLQLFCGYKSLLTGVYPMRSDNNCAGTLEDFTRTYGDPNALCFDNAKVQTGIDVYPQLSLYRKYRMQYTFRSCNWPTT